MFLDRGLDKRIRIGLEFITVAPMAAGATEPRDLTAARRCLAEAEAAHGTPEGLAKLGEGLALLDDVLGAAAAEHARTARNLATTYAARIYGRIETAIDGDRAVPEPELELFFKLLLAFDALGVELPQNARDVKIEIVRRLIDRYYEGYPAETKQQAIAELLRLRGS